MLEEYSSYDDFISEPEGVGLVNERNLDLRPLTAELQQLDQEGVMSPDAKKYIETEMSYEERMALPERFGKITFARDNEGNKVPSIHHEVFKRYRKILGIDASAQLTLQQFEERVRAVVQEGRITSAGLNELAHTARKYIDTLGLNLKHIIPALQHGKKDAEQLSKILQNGIGSHNTVEMVENMTFPFSTAGGKSNEDVLKALRKSGYVPTLPNEQIAAIGFFLDDFVKSKILHSPQSTDKPSPLGTMAWLSVHPDAVEHPEPERNLGAVDLQALAGFFPPESGQTGTYLGHLRDYIGY